MKTLKMIVEGVAVGAAMLLAAAAVWLMMSFNGVVL
jgi:hypothetical protein